MFFSDYHEDGGSNPSETLVNNFQSTQGVMCEDTTPPVQQTTFILRILDRASL